jgi:RpiR family transcriptional regulator, carbohydrate utilization regulator
MTDVDVSAVSRIHTVMPSLSSASRRVADLILDQPQMVEHWSVGRLAERSGTSPATVVRFCQQLGLAGYAELKVLLARDRRRAGTPESSRPEALRLVQAAVAAHVGALRDAFGVADSEDISDAVEALVSARRVLFVASESSRSAVVDASDRWREAGFDAMGPMEGADQKRAAERLGANDLCMALSSSGDEPVLVSAVEAAARRGATTIAVTTFPIAPLAMAATHRVAVGVHAYPVPGLSFTSRLPLLTVFEGIVAAALSMRANA